MIPLASHDADPSANGITWPKRSCCFSFQLTWPDKWNGVIGDTGWHHATLKQASMASNDQKFMLHLILIILLNKCSGAIDDAFDITWCWCWCQWKYKTKKSCCVSYFDHLDLTNGIVPLMTLLALCDTDTNISGITWPKRLCDMGCFNTFDPNEHSDAIDNTIGITWYWWQSQQCGMTERHVAYHFNHLEQTYAAVLLMMPWCHVLVTLASHGLKRCCIFFQSSWPRKQNSTLHCNQCNVTLALVLTASHDKKSHFMPCFNCLHPMNKMMPLMI